jgi:glycerol-3-phosphate dehydrogenase (NAD(P)+)
VAPRDFDVSTIAVIGAGAWGTALAIGLARNGHRVTLCVRRVQHLAAICAQRENESYLPGVTLPDSLALSDQWVETAAISEIVVMAVPSRFARDAMTPLGSTLGADKTLVSVAKGIEEGTLKTMTAMLAEVAPGIRRIAVLSGPSFAAEVARGRPAAVVAASRDESVALALQRLFASRALRVYRSTDVIGVELAGAAKNVIAIAAGICDGLGLGLSARAALITRGLAEIGRLAVRAGGRNETMAGLAGLGDLVMTCTGQLSRNHAIGLAIGRGENIVAPSSQGGYPVAEGISNAGAIRRLAEQLGVEMPIVTAVCRVLYEGASANAMVEELLRRGLKAEF